MDIKVDANTVVVFDLDDTLYNELDFLKSAYRSIAIMVEPKKWKQLYSKMFSLYRCRINVFEFISNDYDIEIKLLVDMYRNHYPDIKLFDGVLDIFKLIKAKNGKIGLITDGRSNTQRSKLDSLGIMEYLDAIVISEEIGSEKPSLANFRAIENSLPGTAYYYIADNLKKDFITPNSLGWKSVGLMDNGKNVHFESYKYMEYPNSPHFFIESLREINLV